MISKIISHYRILNKLGAGGMGEVYLAEDIKLRRKVALKVLPPELSQSDHRMRRFEQEAQAASALNHPNILTIYEVGSEGENRFIATEFIEGETLRQHMQRTQMSLLEVLDVAIQVAGALAAAHQAGIVHRDIKPENIMLRADGYIKVLDFGLAKLIEQKQVLVDTDASTVIKVDTEPGVVMGTPYYMSPEQARGIKIDVRTDIFSLGVVCYEMITGQPPFQGQSVSDIIASILTKEPKPLNSYSVEIPGELQRIVSKTLRKDREERYQTIKDLLVDFKSLRHELELDGKVKPSLQPELDNTISVAANRRQAMTELSHLAEARANHEAPVQTTSATEIIRGIKRHRKAAALILLMLSLVLVSMAFGLYKLLDRSSSTTKTTVPSNAMEMTLLSNTGQGGAVAISTDGRYVAFAKGEFNRQSLWVRQIITGNEIQIVPPSNHRYFGLTFSPENDHIYYLRDDDMGGTTTLYRVSVLGGPSKKLIMDVDTPVTFSPDGKQLAFTRGVLSQGIAVIVTASADGTDEQIISRFKHPCSAPAWSSDGQFIFCGGKTLNSKDTYMSLYEISLADGQQKQISSQKWPNIITVAWDRVKNRLFLLGQDRNTGNGQIWAVSYETGEVERITNDLSTYVSLSLTSDSSALTSTRYNIHSTIWVLPSVQEKQPREILKGGYDGIAGFAWGPDNRIVYATVIANKFDIFISDIEGNNQKRLTDDSSNASNPSTSANGRYVMYESNGNIWRMDIDGSNPKRLTSSGHDSYPRCSPDNKWVVYVSKETGYPILRRVGIDGEDSEQLTNEYSEVPAISPDGKMIACFYGLKTAESDLLTFRLAIVPTEGGGPLKIFNDSPISNQPGGIQWTPDGSAIAYVSCDQEACNIWTQHLDGSAPKQLTYFESGMVFRFEWSRDGKQIALARGSITADVVLITGIR